MSGICTPSSYTLDCNSLCQERWLPEFIYNSDVCKAFDDIQIYGNCEVLHTTLTELGGIKDVTAEAFGSVPNLGMSILKEIEHKIKIFQSNKINDERIKLEIHQ